MTGGVLFLKAVVIRHNNALLLNEIKAQITKLPTYGYRHACALLNRQRARRQLAAGPTPSGSIA